MRTCVCTASRRRWLAALCSAAVLTAVSACSAGAESSAQSSAQSSGESSTGSEASATPSSNPPATGTVIQPGHPGEEAETLAPDASVPEVGHNDADVEFVQMMIPHHAQALEMGQLARTRAQNPKVKAVAARIADAQGAEILEMSAWLERHGIEAPTAADLAGGAHDGDAHGGGGHHAMMPGMLSEDQMDALAAAEGHRFDVLYLQGMIAHHQGAVEMAGQVMEDGTDVRISEIGTDVAAGQSAEIERMKELLRQL